MSQRFYASPRDTFTSANGAIGHRIGGSFDCLGPYAKVRNCPIEGTNLRLTCYATGYADTHFSVPACTRYRGQYIKGYFTDREDGTVFVPMIYSRPKLRTAFAIDAFMLTKAREDIDHAMRWHVGYFGPSLVSYLKA